jgi:hypothetical protein
MNIRTFWKGALGSAGNPLLPFVAPDTTPVAKTGVSGTIILAISDMNGIITNTGTTNVLALTLPTAATSDTKCFSAVVLTAFQVTVVPATGDKIYLKGSGTTNATLILANTIGNYADLYCDGSNWLVVDGQGLTKSS